MTELPTAHLILKDRALENAEESVRVARMFTGNGVAAENVHLYSETDRQAHFAMYREIDIALDPFPHSGGMTTLDALWMGVPVVTCPGQTISSRLAAATLSALSLDHLIARDRDDYLRMALATARDTDCLAELRSRLRGDLAQSEFGNPVRYSRAVESACRNIWRRWCQAQAAP